MTRNDRKCYRPEYGNVEYLHDVDLLHDNTWPMIQDESDAQYKKWGCQRHHMFAWLAFTMEEMGELAKAMSEYLYRDGPLEDVAQEAIQAGTLAIKIANMAQRILKRDGTEIT